MFPKAFNASDVFTRCLECFQMASNAPKSSQPCGLAQLSLCHVVCFCRPPLVFYACVFLSCSILCFGQLDLCTNLSFTLEHFLQNDAKIVRNLWGILGTLLAHFEVALGGPLRPKSMFPRLSMLPMLSQGAWSACRWLQMLPKALNHVAWLICPLCAFVCFCRPPLVFYACVCVLVLLYSLLWPIGPLHKP